MSKSKEAEHKTEGQGLQDQLAALDAEAAAWQDEYKRAIERGDVSSQLALERRQAELPRHRNAVVIQIERAILAGLEERLPEAKQRYSEATEQNSNAQAVLKAAQDAAKEAQTDWHICREQVRAIEHDITARRHRIAELTAAATRPSTSVHAAYSRSHHATV